MWVCALVLGALLGLTGAASPTTIKIGLILDDFSMINATEMTAAVAAVNGDSALLDNVTVAMNVAKQSSSQYFHKQLCDIASSGVTTAISVTRCRNLPTVKSSFNNFNIPVINIGPEPCDIADDAVFVNAESQLSDIAVFVKDLAIKAEWTRTNIFYDSTFSSTTLNKVQGLLTTAGVYVSLINLDTTTNLEATMSSIYNIYEKSYWKYMIAASPANTLNVLDKAKKKALRDKDKAWMIINPDVSYTNIEPLLDVLDNIAIIRRVNRQESWMCDTGTPETALKALVKTVAEGHEDLIASGSWTDQTVSNCAGTWSMGDELMAFTKAKIAAVASDCANYTQYEARSTIMGESVMTFKRSAKWNSVQGMTMTEKLVFPNKYNGFNRKLFKVSTLPYSFFMQKTVHENGTVEYWGLNHDILVIMAKNLNFTFTYSEPADQYWGAPDTNGEWNGIIRELIDKSVDLAAATHSITASRALVVDFADAYYFEPSVIMVKNPGAGSRLTVYIEPLHKWVWLCMFASIPILSFIMWLLMKYSPFYTNQDQEEYMESVNLMRPGPCFWYIFGALWQQGGVDMPKAMSTRFILLVWWLFVVVILATYSGNLIAFLTVTKVTLPFTSLSDVAASTSMKFGTIKGSALWNLFETSKTGAPQRFWTGMDKSVQPNSYGEGKDMVLTGDFALVCERSYYESASENDCDLAMVPKEEFFYSSYGYAVQKDNPLKVLLSEQINALSESGVLEKLRKDWTPAQRCNGLTFTQSKPAGLDDTQGGFIVLGFGVGISIIAMITEVIWFYCIRKKVEGKKFGPITFGSRISMRSDNKVRPMTD